MRDDWSVMIEEQKEYNRRHNMVPKSEEIPDWSEWEMDVDQE